MRVVVCGPIFLVNSSHHAQRVRPEHLLVALMCLLLPLDALSLSSLTWSLVYTDDTLSAGGSTLSQGGKVQIEILY